MYKIELAGRAPAAQVRLLPGISGTLSPISRLCVASSAPGSLQEISLLLRGSGRFPRHVSRGDVFASRDGTLYAVTDVELTDAVAGPEAAMGGVLDDSTAIHLAPEALLTVRRVRFAPAQGQSEASDADCDALKRTLRVRRLGGDLLYVSQGVVVRTRTEAGAEKLFEVHSVDDDAERRGVLGREGMVAVSTTSPSLPAHCMCCRVNLHPPSPAFRGLVFECPRCATMVANPLAPLWTELASASPGPGRDLLHRVRAALVTLNTSDHRVGMMTEILARLPRDLYGRLDYAVLNEIARRIEVLSTEAVALRGTPPEFVARLPTCAWAPTMQDSSRCEICLCEYIAQREAGEQVRLRILPCFHKFHCACIDSWLAVSTTCPLCKTPVDTDFADSLLVSDP
jgi:hypothetical protein